MSNRIALAALVLTASIAPPTRLDARGSELFPATGVAVLQAADTDGDGVPELLALDAEGRLSVHRAVAGGRFEDATAQTGLERLEGATCALLADLDGDGDLDLFAGSADSRVWLNSGRGSFLPAGGGLAHDAVDEGAATMDLDGDGKLDLLVSTELGQLPYRNLGGAHFEPVELPGADLGKRLPSRVAGDGSADLDPDADPSLSPSTRRLRRWRRQRAANARNASNSAVASGPTIGGANPVNPAGLGSPPSTICAGTLVDQATSQCIEATSVPTLGQLFPLTSKLFVSTNGDVGIGTITPGRRLDVLGSVRATGYLEIAGLRTEEYSSTYETVSVIGGSGLNYASTSAYGATIGGGGNYLFANIVHGPFGTIAGGVGNVAGTSGSGIHNATVGGGYQNRAGANNSTVSGGTGNVASGTSATVAGGYFNNATGSNSAVGGGQSNTASGAYSMAPGGADNEAAGDYSCAMGRNARTSHSGTFVWADNSTAAFDAAGANMFLIRASGGVGIGTDAPEAALHVFDGYGGPVIGSASATAILESGGDNHIQFLNTGSYRSGLMFSDSVNGAAGGIYYNSTVATNGLDFRCNGDSTKLVLDQNGRVGIGTTSPGARMHAADGSAGAVTPSPSASAVFERSTDNYLQILTPSADESGVVFGNPANASAGGIYYNATVPNGLTFRCDGDDTKMVLDQNGLLGVGTSAPATVMHIAQAGNPTMRIQDLDAGGPTYHVGIAGGDDSLRISETGVADRIVVRRTSGHVGIGTALPFAPLHVFDGDAGIVNASANASAVFERDSHNYVQLLTPNADEAGLIFGSPSHSAAGGIYYNSTVANGLSFRCNGNSTKMVIDDFGSVGIGTTSPGFLLHVNGTAGKPGGGSWSVASDARLKTNVAELDGALAKLLELRGVTYEYKDPSAIHELEGEQTGFLAQEVERVFPEWVETGADGYKRLSIRGFEALTVEALRELRTEADARAERDAQTMATLASQVATLEAKAAESQAQIEALRALVSRALEAGALTSAGGR